MTSWEWINCEFGSYKQAAAAFGINDTTVKEWIAGFSNELGNPAPESRQHFDIWSFPHSDGDTSYFGALPPQIVEKWIGKNVTSGNISGPERKKWADAVARG